MFIIVKIAVVVVIQIESIYTKSNMDKSSLPILCNRPPVLRVGNLTQVRSDNLINAAVAVMCISDSSSGYNDNNSSTWR